MQAQRPRAARATPSCARRSPRRALDRTPAPPDAHRGSPAPAAELLLAARIALCVRIREPPEVMRIRGRVDDRELRMPERVEAFGPELPAHAGLFAAAERPCNVVE